MQIDGTMAFSHAMISFICLALLLVGGLLVIMRLRHKYHPNLIGALIGGMLCFLLLEVLPALT
ncbi:MULTISPECIES: hypothetical protein [Paraburkholderia]|uniref:Uncharacterized protein n=1 Tax=Paraburkholderia tuberum TaxID=157910 RepID=A0A1H1B9Z7_9BURK|nr:MULTISPECIES: hypothetical protein [Paraburkholderia]MBB5407072.1 hypothetical protein [Paraburkholderia sp. HC6.4b]MBB5449469.1 hypothetical protein [Paraburkholderia sp. Kb1A]MBC8725024.1 hypothetical protein [Paraburkholderia sp. 31.1]SDQ48722.1 hypothetical protein SAMN05445850_0781 [Paraburkholderia tuberum]